MVAIGNGLTKLNIPNAKTRNDASKAGDSSNANTFKATVAKNLSTASKATGSTSRNIIYTSRDFGIGAQRSIFGSGMAWNARKYNEKSIGINREVLSYESKSLKEAQEAKYARLYNMSHASCGNQATSNDPLSMLMLANAFATQMAKAKSANKTSSNDGAGGADKSSNTSTTTSTSSTSTSTKSLSEMKNAKDSSTLRGAIETAKSDKTKMESDLKSLEAQLPQMKEASEAATKQLEELKPKVEAKEKEVKNKEADVKEKEGQVNEKKTSAEAAEKRLASCDKAFNDACTQYGKAQTALTQAKTSLASAKANIDPNTKQPFEPAYSNAKAAVNKAEQDLKQAEAQKEAAAGTLEQAKADNNTAKQVYLNAQNSLKEANTALNTSKQELGQLKEELAPLKQQQSDAQKQVDAYKTALDQQTELKSNIASLETGIPAQEKRLTELENKEAKGLKGAENTILEMADKLAGKDGKLGTDDDKKKLKAKDQEKLDNAKNLQRNVNYTKLYNTKGETINGKTFRTAEYNGETLYMIGAKKVDKDTYDKARWFADNANLGKV